MFNTDRNKTLRNEKALEDMAIVTNRVTSQIRTTSNYGKMNTKCNYMHVNSINMIMIEIFIFLRLSDSKHRLLMLYIKEMVLLKTFNGTLSACDRFMLKIFFCGMKRMYM